MEDGEEKRGEEPDLSHDINGNKRSVGTEPHEHPDNVPCHMIGSLPCILRCYFSFDCSHELQFKADKSPLLRSMSSSCSVLRT